MTNLTMTIFQSAVEVAKRLGFCETVNIGLTGESKGLVPTAEWKKEHHNDDWRMGDTLNLSIGQGFLNATPLQIVTAVARIAGGKNIHPTLLKSNIEDDPETLNFNPIFLKAVRSGMYDVVNKKEGTAYGSRLDYSGQKMAGKTASTQVRRITKKEREKGIIKQEDLPWKYRDHGMFAAFAPVQNPRFAIVVMIEHGGGGSSSAAPVAAKILTETLKLYPKNN